MPSGRARLQAEVARQRVRIAKEELKRARKRLKEAKREAKRARKRLRSRARHGSARAAPTQGSPAAKAETGGCEARAGKSKATAKAQPDGKPTAALAIARPPHDAVYAPQSPPQDAPQASREPPAPRPRRPGFTAPGQQRQRHPLPAHAAFGPRRASQHRRIRSVPAGTMSPAAPPEPAPANGTPDAARRTGRLSFKECPKRCHSLEPPHAPPALVRTLLPVHGCSRATSPISSSCSMSSAGMPR